MGSEQITELQEECAKVELFGFSTQRHVWRFQQKQSQTQSTPACLKTKRLKVLESPDLKLTEILCWDPKLKELNELKQR